MTPQRAVVTGGAGFLGSHLCHALLGEGYSVVVDNLLTGPPTSGSVVNAPPGQVQMLRPNHVMTVRQFVRLLRMALGLRPYSPSLVRLRKLIWHHAK
jgi:hypothetical protein